MQPSRSLVLPRAGSRTMILLSAAVVTLALAAGGALKAAGQDAADVKKPPAISAPATSEVTFSRATITWKTDRPSTSRVRWGTTPAYENASPESPALVTEHKVVLSGLRPATTYHYRITSRDAAGKEASQAVDAPFTTTVDTSAPFEFAVTVTGPRNGTRGRTLYVAVGSKLIAGTPRNIDLSVDEGASSPGVSFSFLQGYGAGQKTATVWNTDGSATLAVDLKRAPVGPGRVRVVAGGGEGVAAKRIDVPFTVRPVPVPPKKPVRRGPVGPIPGLAQWEANMTAKGKMHCGTRLESGGLWEGNVWYYDGARVYQQIADYTGDASWLGCADRVHTLYRDGYVLANKGGIPGWRIFTHGMREHYMRTADPRSREGVLVLAKNAAGANPATPLAWSISPDASRETAYRILSFLDSDEVGGEPHPHAAAMVDIALGHIDQWFVSKSADYVRPFMFALTAEALIEYERKTGDPRVVPAIRAGADGIWDWWLAEQEAFAYTNVQHFSGGREPAPDLNLLIVPVYSYLYERTGDPKYLARGKRVFSGGVKRAWLDQGKPFSQNYRWSFDFVRTLKMLDRDPARDKAAPVVSAAASAAQAPQPGTLAVTTSEMAECRYALTPGVPYAAMTRRFRTYTGRLHRAPLTGLSPGRAYTFYVKAVDGAGNVTKKDHALKLVVPGAGAGAAPGAASAGVR